MDNYIINPMWFYWADVLSKIDKVLLAIITVSFFVAALSTISRIVEENVPKKLCTISAIITIISGIAFIAIPTKEAFIKMQVAKLATKGNVEIVLQKIDEKTDKLIEAIGNKGE